MQVDLEIVSPEKLLLSRPVDMVVIPAAEGEPGPIPLSGYPQVSTSQNCAALVLRGQWVAAGLRPTLA